MSKEYAAAIDLSGREAGFALFEGSKLLLSLIIPMRGRDSAQLALFVRDALNRCDADLNEVRRWSVGSGPGSFTGMRLAAALVEGWSFGKPEMASRCVPSAIALAANLDATEGDRIGTLFDGRNKELIFFEQEFRDGEFVPTGAERILNGEQSAVFFSGYTGKLVAFEHDLPALRKLTDAPIQVFPSIQPEALLLARYKPYDNNLSDLVYIRPAVFT